MKKWLLMLLSGTTLLHAAVDSGYSYFNVSTHEPAAGQAVEVKIFLRDGENRPVDATKVEFAGATGKITRAGAGEYRGQVTLTKAGDKLDLKVNADGATVLENLFTAASAYTKNNRLSAMEQIGNAYRVVSFDPNLDSYWSIGSVAGDNLLRDRTYIVGARASYDDVRGKGVAINSGQRDAAGKLRVDYSSFHTGSARHVQLEKPVTILKDTAGVTFSTVVLHARGTVLFDQLRLRVSPTLVARESEGRKITCEAGGRHVPPAANYLAVPMDKIKALSDELRQYGEKYGSGSFAALTGKLHNIQNSLSKTLDAPTAMRNLVELEKLEAEIKTALGSAERAALTSALAGRTVDAYGPNIRAMAAAPSKDKMVYQQGFRVAVSGKESTHGASAGAWFDRDNLYITVRSADTGSSITQAAPKDDGRIWGGDTIEVFIGDPDSRSSRQFVIGAGGQLFDAQDGDAFVNFEWTGKVIRNGGAWDAEFTLPWSSTGIDPEQHKEFRINICRTYRGREKGTENSCWSLDKTGFHELSSFGFLVLGGNIDEKTFIATKNRQAAEERRAAQAQSNQASAELRGHDAVLIASNWPEERDFEKDSVFQTVFLGEKVRNPDPAQLVFRQAVNEFAHRSFILSALKAVDGVEFKIGDLKGENGTMIPADRLKIYRINYLEPAEEVWPSQYKLWSGRPLPELVELVDAPLTLTEFQSAQFRLVVDSRGAASGKYQGTVRVQPAGVEIPVRCEVMDFALTSCEKQPVWIYIFSEMPWSGASGEAWAKLFQEHYVTDVLTEFPAYTVNGEPPKLPSHKKYNTSYIDAMVNYAPPAGADIKFDGSKCDIDGRLEICARYGLRPLFSTRRGDVPPALFPQFLEYLKSHGIGADKFIYKLGDEDNSPWMVPQARKILSCAPETRLIMIPSGNDYWDLKVLGKGFPLLAFSRAALWDNPKTEADLRHLQKNGMKLARYTNRTSWTERAPALSGRGDLWDVIINDKMDGYQIWTSGICPPIGYRLPYGGATRRAITDWAPENQSNCQLLYVRKIGDFYKPVSCIRLEDMRDGVTDVLYYREAERRLKQANDTAGLQQLRKLATSPKRTRVDYENARIKMAELILTHKQGD